MKTMMPAVIAIALASGLGGCSTAGHPLGSATASPEVDGIGCAAPGATGPVYIDIVYAADGTPSANPSNCSVFSGTDVTWRGPDGEPVDFQIKFKATSPVLDDERLVISAVKADTRYKVKRKVAGAKGTYTYGIKANGKETDPAVIIK